MMKTVFQRNCRTGALATVKQGKVCVPLSRQVRHCSTSPATEKKDEILWPSVVSALIITSGSVFASLRVPEASNESDKESLEKDGLFLFCGTKFSASCFMSLFMTLWISIVSTRFGGALTWSATLKRSFIDQWCLNILLVAGVVGWNFKALANSTKEEWLAEWQNTFGNPQKQIVLMLNQGTRAVLTIVNYHFVPLPYRILVASTLYAHETALDSALLGRDILLAQKRELEDHNETNV